MPTLSNLTPEQYEICDTLWGMDTMEEIVSWINRQPGNRFFEAWSMLHMILAAMIDDQELHDMPEATTLINKIKARL